MPRAEADLLAHLGVPATATEIVIVAESTHWDPNWLLRSEQYYRWCVRPTLDRVLAELAAQPRRIFDVECIFFIERYWQDHPQSHETIRQLVNDGRLRFTGSGVTTPDTLLVEDEMLLRDALIGQEWLRSHGMNQEPRVWYFPDSFGHTPGLPAILDAARFDYAVVCRIDGMRFPGADFESADHFPRPMSSAATLINAKTADFIWRAPDGTEKQTHWVSHSYGQADMIASRGLSRTMGLPIAWADRRPTSVDTRITTYLNHLRPLARTPYRLLPAGMDFARPIPDLVGLLDAWNERNHAHSGTWLVNAGLDDYLDLVAAHKYLLPTIDFDPNPYWMGFYASRPSIKARTRALGRRLIADDARRAKTMWDQGTAPAVDRPTRQAHWIAAVANHHDFVTGTSPDRVALTEQARWLNEALVSLPPNPQPPNPQPPNPQPPNPQPPNPQPPHADDDTPVTSATQTPHAETGHATPPTVVIQDHAISITAPWGTMILDKNQDGALTSYRDSSGTEHVAEPSLVLVSHVDTGGLWRMGHEFAGGTFRPARNTPKTQPTRLSREARVSGGAQIANQSDTHISVQPAENANSVMVIIHTTIDRQPATLRHTINSATPTIVTQVSIAPRLRRTITLAITPMVETNQLVMHQPGAIVTRPLTRWYRPTYWPLHSFALHLPRNSNDGSGSGNDNSIDGSGSGGTLLAVAAANPTAIGVTANGATHVVVARQPFKELAYGALPVMAPAWGWERERQHATIATKWISPIEPIVASGRALSREAEAVHGYHTPQMAVSTNDANVEVITHKPASRGEGVIVRLRNWKPRRIDHRVELTIHQQHVDAPIHACLVDARERDVEGGALVVTGNIVQVPIKGHFTSVRLSHASIRACR